jgi:hypothetical protein
MNVPFFVMVKKIILFRLDILNSEVNIRVFRAIDDEESCIRYLEGHRKVLIEHGFSHFKTNTQDWFYNPNIYVLIAEDCTTHEYVGGVRLEIADDTYELPSQKALKKIDPRIVDYIALHQKDGLAEGCGLWNSKSVAGKKISVLLVRAATAVSTQLKITKLIAFLATYTSYIIYRMGFVAETSLGEEGTFNYPTDQFIAKVYLNDHIFDLKNASDSDKEIMLILRENPIITLDEMETNTPIRVHYNLKLK